MRCIRLSSVFLLFSLCLYANATDIEVKQNPVAANSFAVVKYKLDKGDSVQWIVVPEPTEIEEFKTDTYAQCHFNGADKKYVVYALITNFDTKTQSKKRIEVVMGKAPQPPPVDPIEPVVPVDPDTKPIVVKTFRVILVQDPTATLTQAQFNTLNAKSVTDYLTENCTKDDGQPGWRKFSIRQKGDNEVEGIKAVWAVAQPQIKPTDPPCVVIEVNGKAEIVSLSSSPEEQIAVFKKYKGGTK